MLELHHTDGAIYVVLRDKAPSSGGRVFNTPIEASGYAIAEKLRDRGYNNLPHDYRIFRLIEVDRNGEPVV